MKLGQLAQACNPQPFRRLRQVYCKFKACLAMERVGDQPGQLSETLLQSNIVQRRLGVHLGSGVLAWHIPGLNKIIIGQMD